MTKFAIKGEVEGDDIDDFDSLLALFVAIQGGPVKLRISRDGEWTDG